MSQINKPSTPDETQQTWQRQNSSIMQTCHTASTSNKNNMVQAQKPPTPHDMQHLREHEHVPAQVHTIATFTATTHTKRTNSGESHPLSNTEHNQQQQKTPHETHHRAKPSHTLSA